VRWRTSGLSSAQRVTEVAAAGRWSRWRHCRATDP
jgi:hypothetical protein